MHKVLLIGFKGKNNSSSMLVERLSSEYVLLTNSFDGLKRDIDSINSDYDCVLMFGVDKALSSSVRIEKCAEKNGEKISSVIDPDKLIEALKQAGMESYVSEEPTAYLCNEAYWHILRKYSGRAVFIHIPTIKYVNEQFIESMKIAYGLFLTQNRSDL